MSGDHLDKGISVSGQLVERGIQFRAQSRAVSGIDRLLGNLTELVNAPLERRAARIRAEQALIEALGQVAIERASQDVELAKQVLDVNIRRVARQHFNKQEVVSGALEDLSVRPPDLEQSKSGSTELDPAFLNRIERYAEDAEDDAVREKWARVLAGEIRRPGCFTAKTMRLIDEISPDIAQAFHNFCRHRIGDSIPKLISGGVSFNLRSSLEDAGLLVPGQGGTSRIFPKVSNNTGEEIWLGMFGERAIGIPATVTWPNRIFGGDFDVDSPQLLNFKEQVSCPVFLLTEAGLAIASLADHDEADAWQRFVACVAKSLPGTDIVDLKKDEDKWIPIGRHNTPIETMSDGSV